MTGNLGIDRIVVILDPGGEHRTAIHSAVELASALNLPLHGIFAEDEALLDLAGHSIASHMGLGNLLPQVMERDFIDAALKVEARRSQLLLDAAARQSGVAATFALWRGYPSLLSMGAGEHDLVVVEGFSRPLTGQAQLPSPWPRRVASDGVSVLVLKRGLARHLVIGSVTDDDAANRSLRIANPLAKRLAGSVVVLRPGQVAAHATTQERSGMMRGYAELECDMVVLDENLTDSATSSALIAEGHCSVLLLRRR
jgi:hypothetical protein